MSKLSLLSFIFYAFCCQVFASNDVKEFELDPANIKMMSCSSDTLINDNGWRDQYTFLDPALCETLLLAAYNDGQFGYKTTLLIEPKSWPLKILGYMDKQNGKLYLSK